MLALATLDRCYEYSSHLKCILKNRHSMVRVKSQSNTLSIKLFHLQGWLYGRTLNSLVSYDQIENKTLI